MSLIGVLINLGQHCNEGVAVHSGSLQGRYGKVGSQHANGDRFGW